MKRILCTILIACCIAAVSSSAFALTCEGVRVILPHYRAGTVLSVGDIVYLSNQNRWLKADANGTGTYPAVGVVTEAAAAEGTPEVSCTASISGYSGLTVGGAVYLSETAGGYAQSAPAMAQVIGLATNAGTVLFDIRPPVFSDGALDATSLSIGGVAVTATAAELNTLDGVNATLTAAELNILDGVTATTSQLNTTAVTAGTATASKAAVLGTHKELDEVHAGTLYLGASSSADGTAVTATAAQINNLAQRPGNVITVGASGCDYTTVTAAVAAATAGDLVIVMPGTYAEDVVCPHTIKLNLWPGASVQSIKYRQAVTVTTDSDGYVLPVVVRRGAPSDYDSAVLDIGCDNLAAADLSDIGFELEDGTAVDFFQHNAGAYEMVPDTRLGTQHIIVTRPTLGLAVGDIVATGLDALSGIFISTDNGATWLTQVYDHPATLCGIDRDGNIYFSDSFSGRTGLYRATFDGSDWTAVNVLGAGTTPAMTEGHYVLAYGLTQDQTGGYYDGYIYTVGYGADNYFKIYRSVDGGATWTDITPDITGTVTTPQHVHGIAVDPYTGAVYAGVDGSSHAIIKTVDGGANWTLPYTNWDADVTAMLFLPERILFCGGAGASVLGTSILAYDRLADAFSASLRIAASVQGIVRIGETIFASAVSYGKSVNSQVMVSTDNGLSWKTGWLGPREAGGFSGLYNISNVGINGQAIIGPAAKIDVANVPLRLMAGVNYHQSFCYVKVPANATTIYATYGSGSAGASDVTIFETDDLDADADLILHWKFDGDTTNAVNPGAANGDGTIVVGGISYKNGDGTMRGPAYPRIQSPGQHILKDGTGYVRVLKTAWAADPTDLVQNVTALCWVKMVPNGAYQVIFGRSSHASYLGQWVLFLTNSAIPTLGLTYGNGNVGDQQYETLICPNSFGFVADNLWHQVGIIIGPNTEGSLPQSMYFVVDSQIGTAVPLVDFPITSVSRKCFGVGGNPRDDATVNGVLTGEMDDVRVYGRMLNATEIRRLYEAGKVAAQ